MYHYLISILTTLRLSVLTEQGEDSSREIERFLSERDARGEHVSDIAFQKRG